MKYNTPKKVGNELETLVKEMLINSKIPFKQENTMVSSGKRSKGSVDFILENPEGYIECKRFTKSLALGMSATTRGINWNQVRFMHKKLIENKLTAWVIQETTDKRIFYITHQDLIDWWTSTTMKSLSLSEAIKIGKEIKDFDFINNALI